MSLNFCNTFWYYARVDAIGTNEEAEIKSPENFLQTKERYSLTPTAQTEETGHFLSSVTSPHMRTGFENTKQNPSRIYRSNEKYFFGIWINSFPYSPTDGHNIGWEKTLQEVGDRERVHNVLDTLAYCYKEADELYDWEEENIAGFSVVGDDNFGMDMGKGLGIQVSYPNTAFYIARALKNNDPDKLRLNVASTAAEFVHEKVHNEYNQGPGVFTGSPEAVAQGCQFLYLPGENHVFEDQIRATLEKARQVLTEDKGARLGAYQRDNVVWMTFLQNLLAKRFPDRFQALGSDGKSNITELGGLISRVASLRKEFGDEQWKQLRKGFMRELIEYDPKDQGTVINDFKAGASRYGFEKLAA